MFGWPRLLRLLPLLVGCAALRVEVAVEAKWPRAPLAAELLEGLQPVEQGSAYLRRLAYDGQPWHQRVVAAAEELLCCEGKSLYGRLLSLRARHAYASATVEAARGMERADRDALQQQGILRSCPVGTPWVLIERPSGLSALCDVTQLAKQLAAAGRSGSRGAPRQSGLDHVLYDASGEDFVEVVGYADLGDDASVSLLRALFETAEALEGRAGRVVFRHATPGAPVPASLGGFGLELLTRSADEVAKSKDGEEQVEASSVDCLKEVTDPAESFQGVDIGVIAKNFPQSSSALCRLREHLVSEAEQPLLPWELTRLGARALLRAQQNGSKLEGLKSLGIVAQDYPSGWGRALVAGHADPQKLRELMALAEDIKVQDSLQVNGWQVPPKQRGILAVLRSQLPLFRAAELLSRELPQATAFELLREAEAPMALATKVDSGDPRLGHRVPSFEQGAVGVGLILDLCQLKQVRFALKILKNRPPALLWLRLHSRSHPVLAAQMQSALTELVHGVGPEVAKKMLRRFTYKRTAKDLCEEPLRVQQLYEEFYPKAPATLDEEVRAPRFPLPSATVNGKVIVGLDLLERTLEKEIQQENEIISFILMQMRQRADRIPEQQLLNFAYGSKQLHPMAFQIEPKLMKAWSPHISSVARHVPLRPELLQTLPGAAEDTENTHVAVFLAVLGTEGQKLHQDVLEILDAFLELGRGNLRLAIVGKAEALQRCLLTMKLVDLAQVLRSAKELDCQASQAELEASLAAQRAVLRETGSETALWVNGRLHGPIQLDGSLNGAILEHAEELERPQDAGETIAKLKGLGASDYMVAYVLAVRSRAVSEGFAARSGDDEENEQQQDVKRTEAAYQQAAPELQLHVPAQGEARSLRIFAVMDPLGSWAQRLPPLLQLLHQELDAEIFLALKPRRLAEAPLKSYVRLAPVAHEPGLAALKTWDGVIPGVTIELPPRRGQLLSAQLLAPDAWLCSAVDAGDADLDAVRADAAHDSPQAQVKGRYVVEALFLEGFAEDQQGKPATGRTLALAPLAATEPMAGSDSVVVKSGYFQLRQMPGVYKLSLHSQKTEKLQKPRGLVHLTDLAGRGSLLETLVVPGEDTSSELFASNLDSAKTFEGAGGDRSCRETLHIFSVASGLRYERLLRIMMLSVRKHTNCPLRFWLVENFLSASFRRILPGLAEKVGFAVSTVTYKWPTWLREQVQKQRVIWAFKVLFLDVFFPAEVKRILFIDADQIVRADVQELWKTDLKGKVYGFVPFCGSGPPESLSMWKSLTGQAKQEDLKNPETVGFRFWEQGFWKTHLRDRHFYHISALFVVDLVAFRRSAAGDILRDVYQSLTADPHSLANLDQDLPNYIQSNLPIHSLPQEWLWCESWCSEGSKKNAKTIDMCQHPSKKEGKLQQARRIAPEWSKYDEELQQIIAQLKP